MINTEACIGETQQMDFKPNIQKQKSKIKMIKKIDVFYSGFWILTSGS
jgi:hypothetical protein